MILYFVTEEIVIFQGSSVFDRLGGQNEESPSAVRGSALQYAGILKSPPRIKPKPLINIIQSK